MTRHAAALLITCLFFTVPGAGVILFEGGGSTCPTNATGANFPGLGGANDAYIQALDVTDNTVYFSHANDFTVITWAKSAATSVRIMVSQNDTAISQQMALRQVSSTQWGANHTGDTVNVTVTSTQNVWQLVAYVYDTTDNDGTLYVYDADCVSLGSTTDTSISGSDGTANPMPDLDIGLAWDDKSTSDGKSQFDGDLAYVFYAEGLAMTQAQIESYCANPCSSASTHDAYVVFFYPLDNANCTDYSSAGNTCTIVEEGTGEVTAAAAGPYAP